MFRRSWRSIVLVQLIAVIPIVAAVCGFEIWLAVGPLEFSDVNVNTANTDFSIHPGRTLYLAIAAGVVALFLLMVLSLLTQLASLHLLVQTVAGRPVSVGAALRAGLRRLLPLVGWIIVTGLVGTVGLAFCFLPGLYVAAVSTILVGIVLFERGNGLGRAFKLFNANFGASLGRVAAMLAVSTAVSTPENLISSAIRAGDPGNVALIVVASLFTGVLSLGSSAFLAPMLLVTYADLRARHEPFSTAYLTAAPQPEPTA